MAGVRSHYLRGNASEWSPSNVIFIDTETSALTGQASQLLQMRLWCAASVDRRQSPVGGVSVRSEDGTDRHSLARWVDAQTVGHQTTWLYCHNLGFDLTVSRLPDFLHRLGWQMTRWDFAGRNVTGSMRKRTKRLRLCDSVSVLPTKLEDIGRQLGRHKLPMPAPTGTDSDWLTYCQTDVLILAEAILTVMDWWDEHRLGHWTSSGPGLGWNALRHQGRERLVLIDWERGTPADDRPAIRGGRRDVTRVGEVEGGPFALVDFSNAYLTVAANCLLPKGRLAHYDKLEPTSPWLQAHRLGVLADCEVDTPEPAYPLRTPGGIFYPVGRFRTPLCSPEIEVARQAGHLRSIGSAWTHDLGYPLKDWADWCLSLLDKANDQVPAVVRTMVKQWGRSVPGKFAARSSTSTDLGPALYPGWKLIRGSSGPDHKPAADVHIAGRHWWTVFDQEGENAYPAVLAWIESHVRVALNAMLEALGPDMWVCCDTDGVVVDLTKARSWLRARSWPLGRMRGDHPVAEAVCEALRPVCEPLVPRLKVLSRTLTVNGPQHYAGDTFTKMAGRPGKPELDDEGHLHWYKWPRVAWQMADGSQAGFVRTEAHWTHPSQLAHRWVLPDGLALPVEAAIGDDGVSYIKPWSTHPLADMLGDDIPVQSTALRGLY